MDSEVEKKCVLIYCSMDTSVDIVFKPCLLITYKLREVYLKKLIYIMRFILRKCRKGVYKPGPTYSFP